MPIVLTPEDRWLRPFLRSGGPVFLSDIAQIEDRTGGAVSRLDPDGEWRAMSVCPVPMGDRSVAALVALDRIPRQWEPWERGLLSELSRVAWGDEEGAAPNGTWLGDPAGLLAGVLALSEDAVVSLDRDQRITMFNRGAEEIFQYSAEEVLGQPLGVLLPIESRDQHREQVRGFGTDGTGATRRMADRRSVQGRRKDGSVFPAEASISRHELDQDVVYTAVLRDISERVRAARQLTEKADELQRSNEALERFAFAASHDMKEPLRMIESYCDLLQRRYGDRLDQDGQEFLEFAVDGARRLQAIVDGLLNYATAGSFARGTASLTQAVGDATRNLAGQIEMSGGRVQFDDLPDVPGDTAQLTIVFQNLISNGLKFSRSRPPTVSVTSVQEDGEVIVAVEDDGIGIPENQIGEVFRLFRRLHPKDEFAGSGIGLSTARRIVERHAGRITVSSAVGGGSTFSVHLPLGGTDE
jgi:PAS domain S-box-containing protein